MRCSNCSRPVPSGARFCTHCGRRIAPARPPPAIHPRRWIAGLGAAFISALLVVCVAAGLILAPALWTTVQPPPENAPDQDVTLVVKEAYISDMLGEALPEGFDGKAILDVKPDNTLVVQASFKLLIVNLNVTIYAGIAVTSGDVQVWVNRIETGGHNLLALINIDQVTLGDNITARLQRSLEEALGEGAHVLEITTDEEHITLKAKWD